MAFFAARQGDKLVFPSHCGRDRPAVLEHPTVFVSYAVKGFLDDIYATMVVKLANCQSFTLKELWRDAADFVTLVDDHPMDTQPVTQLEFTGERLDLTRVRRWRDKLLAK